MPSIPTISGVLNNCSIGAALPSIIEKIENLAALEGSDIFEEQANLAEYKRIKSHFCNFYDIDENEFTFKQFQNFLKQQSFFSKQMILGPVLREYIAGNAQQTPDYNPEVIRGLVRSDSPEPKNIGRFPGLEPREANQFLYRPLGIEVKFFDLPENTSQYIPVTNGIDAPSAEASEFKISVYHKDGHYELQQHDSLPSIDNSREPFFEFARQCSLGNEEASAQALAQLKIQVKESYLAEPALIEEDVVTPDHTGSVESEEHSSLINSKIEHLAQNVPTDKQANYKGMIKELVRQHETLLKPNNTASRNEDEELAKKLQEEELQAAGLIFRK